MINNSTDEMPVIPVLQTEGGIASEVLMDVGSEDDDDEEISREEKIYEHLRMKEGVLQKDERKGLGDGIDLPMYRFEGNQ